MKLSNALSTFLALASVVDGFSASSFGLPKQQHSRMELHEKSSDSLSALEKAAQNQDMTKDGESPLADPAVELKAVAVQAGDEARLTDYDTEEDTTIAKNADSITVTKTSVETAEFKTKSNDVDVLAMAEPELKRSEERQAAIMSQAEKAAQEATLAGKKSIELEAEQGALSSEADTLEAAKKKAEDAVVVAEQNAAALAAEIELAKTEAAKLLAKESQAEDLAKTLAEERDGAANLADAEAKMKAQALLEAEEKEKIRMDTLAEAEKIQNLAYDSAEKQNAAEQKIADLLSEEEAIRARANELENARKKAEEIVSLESEIKMKALEEADQLRSDALLAETEAMRAKEEAQAKELIEAKARVRAQALDDELSELNENIALFRNMRDVEAAKVETETKRLADAEAAANAKEIELAKIALDAAAKAEAAAKVQEEIYLLQVRMVEEKSREAALMADIKLEEERRAKLERDAFESDINRKQQRSADLAEDSEVIKNMISDEQRLMMERMEELRARVEEMEAEKAKIEGSIDSEAAKKAQLEGLAKRMEADRTKAEETARAVQAKAEKLMDQVPVSMSSKKTATSAEVDVVATEKAVGEKVEVDVKVETDVKVDGEVVNHDEKEGRLTGILKKIPLFGKREDN